MERDFKGIWIPKEIWLCKELTMQEKIFLVEIDSLDNDKGCYANNQYFADFFEISKTRASIVINNLIDKGYITSTLIYKEGTKQILNRVLNINRPPYPTNVIEGIKQSNDRGIQQKLKDNNINNNNIINNTINNKEIYKEEFETLWKLYPKKQGKENAYKDFIKSRKNTSYEEIEKGLNNYLYYIKINKIDTQYIKNGSTWFHQHCWEDDYTIKKELTTKDLAEYMDFSEFRE